jgi:hypothetical protein
VAVEGGQRVGEARDPERLVPGRGEEPIEDPQHLWVLVEDEDAAVWGTGLHRSRIIKEGPKSVNLADSRADPARLADRGGRRRGKSPEGSR